MREFFITISYGDQFSRNRILHMTGTIEWVARQVKLYYDGASIKIEVAS